ncbi:MAG: AI-2E family transporter [Bacteroidota bacterium]|nr:AI-2E family transporter [Candidatus Kapabacteria bacterium]MDW8220496.1 AI-2E family transporter [Bacteroidota bacterium]
MNLLKNLPSSPFLVFLIAAAFFVAYGSFLVMTQLAANPFVLFASSVFLLFPFRNESVHVKRMIVLLCLTFAAWLFREIGTLLAPFFVAFAFAYLFEPIVVFLGKRKFPRWLTAGLLVLGFISLVAAIVVFVFPIILAQLNDIIRELSSLINRATAYLESKQFFRLLSSYGLNSPQTRELIQRELIPRLEGSFNFILRTLLAFLSSLSDVFTQVMNIILTPILMFYFTKDFDKIKAFVINVLSGNQAKLLFDLYRINSIVKAYIGGQAIASILIATASSIIFLVFNIPYAGVIGTVCGLLNPIPYFGMLVSIIIGFITVVVVSSGDAILFSCGIITATVLGLHFLDNYFLQPRIVGQRIGLHPLVLLAALLIFGHFWGIAGLLLAVPITASLMMFFNDWLTAKLAAQESLEAPAEHTSFAS